MSGFRVGDSNWAGIVYVPTTGRLYCTPAFRDSLLIIDPLRNTTDTTVIANLGTTSVTKWAGNMAYAPTTGKIYGAPFQSEAVLVVDPLSNTSDIVTFGGLGTAIRKWHSAAYSPATQKLYFGAFDATSTLVIDPVGLSQDTTSLGNAGASTHKWFGITIAENTVGVYTAPSLNNSVLSIEPELAGQLRSYRGLSPTELTHARQIRALRTFADPSAIVNVGTASGKWSALVGIPGTTKLCKCHV